MYIIDSIIILKVKDGYAEDAVAALNTAFAQNVDYIRQYPFGTEKVLNARIFKDGNYVAFILAGADPDENATAEEEAKLAKQEYEKIDNALKDIFGKVPANLAIVPADRGNNDGAEGFVGG